MKTILFYLFIAVTVIYGLAYFNVISLPILSVFKVGLPAPYKISEGKVKIEVLAYGSGPVSRTGATLVIEYTAKDEYKRIFEQASADSPKRVTIGSGEVVEGFEAGLRGMQAGEKRRITVHPDLAYGTAGNRQLGISPNSEIVYEVTLLKIK